MSQTSDWPVVLEVEGLRCPVALKWRGHDGILNVTMSGDWYANVDIRMVDGVTADEVKKGLAQMFQPDKVARMPEPLRWLMPTLEEKIDAWFAKQPVQ